MFPAFLPSTHYPNPSDINNLTYPYPTNSWAENALVDNIPGNARIIPGIPWYVTTHGNDQALYLSATNSVPKSTIITFGDLNIMDDPDHAIAIRGSNVSVTAVDDLTMTTTLTGITSYIMRGSPFISLEYNNTPVSLEWVIANITDFQPITGGYYVDDNSLAVSTISEKLLLSSNKYISQQLTLMSGFESLNSKVTVTFSGTFLNAVWSSYDLTMDVTNPNNTIVPANVSLITSAPLFGFNITLDDDNSVTIVYITTSQYATVSTNVRTPIRWYIFTNAVLTQNNNTLETAGNYTGLVQLACGGPVSEDQTDLLTALIAGAGTYATSGIATNFVSSNISNTYSTQHDFSFTKVGTGNLLWWLPPHLTDFYVLTTVTMTSVTLDTPMYGRLKLAFLDTNPLVANSFTMTLDRFPTGSNLSPGDKTKLANMVRTDALRTPINTYLSPNEYGQQAATVGRLIMLATMLGIDPETDIQDLITLLKTSLTSWMMGTNSVNVNPTDAYQLQTDTVWGGVVVPADDKTDQGIGSTAQGNSFYHNHHYQYGFFYYALACLEEIGQGLYATYTTKIRQLLFDTVNPTTGVGPTGDSTKIRHKDYYGGHSWETGVTATPARDQMSSGQAINCYFSAWLLASQVGLNDVAEISLNALLLEVAADKTYYQFRPGTYQNPGWLDKVAVAGRIVIWGKKYSLPITVQPDDYPGKSIAMAGFQAGPFIEPAFTVVKQDWVQRLCAVEDFYSINCKLVLGLLDSEYTASTTYVQAPISFDVVSSGGYWGAVGLELLGADYCVPEHKIIEMWFELLAKQEAAGDLSVIQHADSFSNILYWLLQNCRMNDLSIGNYNIYVNQCGQISYSCLSKSIHVSVTMNGMGSDVSTFLVYPVPKCCKDKCKDNCCKDDCKDRCKKKKRCKTNCGKCSKCSNNWKGKGKGKSCCGNDYSSDDECCPRPKKCCAINEPLRFMDLYVGQAVIGQGSLYCKSIDFPIDPKDLLSYGIIRLVLSYLCHCCVSLKMLQPCELQELLQCLCKGPYSCYRKYLIDHQYQDFFKDNVCDC